MAANPLENIPKFAPPPPAAPKAPKQPAAEATSASRTPPAGGLRKGPVPVAAKPKIQPVRTVKTQPEIRRAGIADQVVITARKDQGKFGHVQSPHTPAPKPAAALPPAKPGETPPKAPRPRHAINIVG